METIRTMMQRSGPRLVAAGVLGLALGILYAWVLNPVQWTDATPSHLRQDFRMDFLRAAVDSYAVNRDVDLALARYQALGEAGPGVLAALQTDPGEVSPAALEGFLATISLYEPTASATPRQRNRNPGGALGRFVSAAGVRRDPDSGPAPGRGGGRARAKPPAHSAA